MNTTTNSTSPQIDVFLNNFSIANDVFAIYCVSVHLVYFILMLFIEELRTKPLFFINHSVVANLLYPIALLLFQFFDPSLLNDESTINVVCSIFEIYWPFTIYARMYSILLIAIHRYLAVFNSNLFNRINKSNRYLISLVALIWFVSISISLITKYAFSTTYSISYCLNGFSTSFVESLLYAMFYTLFAMILPSIAIVVIYILISLRLKRVAQRLSSPSIDLGPKKNEMQFANQFIIMCSAVVLSICGNIATGLKGVIPDFFDLFYYWRFVLRCYILFFTSLIPILAFCFNQFGRRIFQSLRRC